MSKLVLSVFFLSAVTVSFAQDKSSSASLISNSVYEKNCAKCHGKSAEGRHFGGPSLVSEKASSASEDDLRSIIANGKGRMPKYGEKLSPEQINRLILQIKAANTK
jgi:mono/diheme cytochrome c family protein